MSGQQWNANRYAAVAPFVPELGAPVVDELAPRPGERILDLGCGDGALTARLAGAGARVVGVDASADMVRAARARGQDARVVDARALPFDAEFDAVFSNAALHWMRDLPAVFAGVRRALVPGGRFVAEMGGHGNVAAVVTALVATLRARGIDGAALVPWRFPTPDELAGLLAAADLELQRVAHFARPTPVAAGMRRWLETFAGDFLAAVDPGARDGVLADAVAALKPALCDASGNWTVDYVRLRFVATRPTAMLAAP